MVRRPVGLIEPVNGNRDGASQTALVALTCVAVVCRVVEHHVPPLGGDGGWYLPVEFVRSNGRFGARRLRHQRTVGLPEFVGLNAVFIEKQEVDGVIHHDDAEVVHVTWRQQPEVNDHAYTRIDGQRWRER